MKRSSLQAALAALLAAMASSFAQPAAAEVQKLMRACEGGLCPMFKPLVAIPDGWTEDREAGLSRGLFVLVPKGRSFGNADALIYARAVFDPGRQSIEAFNEDHHRQWRQRVKDAKIERLADIARPGGEAFMQFRFTAPSLKQQPYELVATTVDTDKDGNRYFVAVVVTGMSKDAVEAAQGAYLGLLRRY